MKDTPKDSAKKDGKPPAPAAAKDKPVPEIGGRKGPDPTRYGDWEIGGKCVDF